MRTDIDRFDLEAAEQEGEGGFLGLALLALAAGAGAALLFAPAEGAETRKALGGRLRDLRGEASVAFERVQQELGRREARRRRQRRISTLVGLAAGAGLAALLVPESGPDTRRRISETIRRRSEAFADAAEQEISEREPEPAA